MSDLVYIGKKDRKVCKSCKYSMSLTGNGTSCNAIKNIACNYREKTGQSRIFVDGQLAYSPEYCDKYEKKTRNKKKKNNPDFILTKKAAKRKKGGESK